MSGKAKESGKGAVHRCHSFIGKLTDPIANLADSNANDLIDHNLRWKPEPIRGVWINVDTQRGYAAQVTGEREHRQ